MNSGGLPMKKLLIIGLLWKLLLLSVGYMARLYNNDFDSSAELLPPISIEELKCPTSDLLGSYLKWDAIHFMAIATKNYPYNSSYLFEHQYAFFPLLPIASSLCAYIFHYRGICEQYHIVMVCALFISIASSIASACILYR